MVDGSASADPQTGYAVYCTVAASGCPSTGNVTVGGTSAAAPLWAGSMALINEYLQKQNKARVGFANPSLYVLANAQQQFAPFHGVTSGDNLFYPATANYDAELTNKICRKKAKLMRKKREHKVTIILF